MNPSDTMLTVCAVIAGVANGGTAYGHNAAGQCLAFTGDRENMIALFQRLRAYLKGEGPAVAVAPGDWQNVHRIDRAECPNHMMPAIKGEIAYYVPY